VSCNTNDVVCSLKKLGHLFLIKKNIKMMINFPLLLYAFKSCLKMYNVSQVTGCLFNICWCSPG